MADTERILLNTDLLVHAADTMSTLHQQARIVLELAIRSEIRGCVSLSVLEEFIMALTSSRHVRNTISFSEAIEEYEKYINLKPIAKIMTLTSTYKTTAQIAKKYELVGSDIKLAEQIATMLDNRVHTICTFRREDYEKFGEISILNPFEFDKRQTLLQFDD